MENSELSTGFAAGCRSYRRDCPRFRRRQGSRDSPKPVYCVQCRRSFARSRISAPGAIECAGLVGSANVEVTSAIGGGSTMLTHCDFAYAGESARSQLPFVNFGLVPECGSSYSLLATSGHI